MEVTIENECRWEMKFIDERFAGTIRETPAFVGKLAKELPALQNVGFGEIKNRCQCTAKELFSQMQRTQGLTTCLQQRERLIYHVVRRD